MFNNLRAVFQRLREKGLTLNKQKCVYAKRTLEFFGNVFTERGIMADPKKIQSIVNMNMPTNASEVRSLLGMTNYCARFIPNYATVSEPLRRLTRQDTPWQWTNEQESALAQLKQKLCNAPVMSYFDSDKQTEIHTDASPVGLGAILIQRGNNNEEHIIAYASRSLTDVEQRYSQTEREALAVVWSCEHFHIYIHGKPVTIHTDHKPLVSLYNNPKCKPPARIERWALRLQPYETTIIYRPGHDNPADYLSRHPTLSSDRSSREEQIAEEYVNYLVGHAVPKAMTRIEIATATVKDKTLLAVIDAIRTNDWSHIANINTNEFDTFARMRAELCVSGDNILLRNSRIVIPESLRERAVNLAHQGHQGIVKTKALIREKVWFPGIDRLVEERVKACIACQIAVATPHREPLQMTQLPSSPWSELSIDFAQLTTGDYLLVVIDDYSRFPVVEIVQSTAAASVIPKLDRILSEFGSCDILKSDNGPPFNGFEFTRFAEYMGFKHRKITPLWPRANGEVERFVKTVKKVIKTAQLEHKNWHQELNIFLRQYRATPHSTTGRPPATMLFGRPFKTTLPSTEPSTVTDTQGDRKFRERDALMKSKMKDYADNKSYVKPSSISVGDTVIVKQPITHNRSLTPYMPVPHTVTSKNHSMITATRNTDGQSVTRNSSLFKGIDNRLSGYAKFKEPSEDVVEGDVTSSDVMPQTAPEGEYSTQQDQNVVRRSKREHKLPARFADYVVN